jgi:hypothetical protein
MGLLWSLNGQGVAGRIRTGTCGLHRPGCSPLHHGHHEVRTTGVEPAPSRWTAERSAVELRPRSRAGGIRTHGLELMRLARTAAPLPRKSARLDSNQRSPVPETGGVAVSPGGSRTRYLPVESRASYRSTTGARRSSGGRARTCVSRVTAARRSARPHRNERDGPGRSRTCAPPIKSRRLSAELRSRDVAGRGPTCGAPRFRRPLYLLSYGHVDRRGWTRTSDLLRVEQALRPTELLACDESSGTRARTSVSTFRAWRPAG